MVIYQNVLLSPSESCSYLETGNMICFRLFSANQRQRMIKMSSVSIQKIKYAMDLRKFCHDIEKLFLSSDLQVLSFSS